MQLATRFSSRLNSISGFDGGTLSVDQLRSVVPSIFAESAHISRSENYAYIPTVELVQQLDREGWAPTFACQAKPRDIERSGHAKHMVRFRHASTKLGGEEVPEIILINSHDGSTSYQMLAGFFRFVCCNGLILGNGALEVRVPHRGQVVDGVLAGADKMLTHFQATTSRVEHMKALTLSAPEQQAFARAALPLRFDDAATVSVDDALRARRTADAGADMWSTLNRVQENLVRGGLRVRNTEKRFERRKTRGVTGIGESVKLNQALWSLAEEMNRLKAAA